jgi:hypothetical protein
MMVFKVDKTTNDLCFDTIPTLDLNGLVDSIVESKRTTSAMDSADKILGVI